MAKVKKQVKQTKKEVPVGVKLISVIYYIGAALCVILGIVGAGAIGSLLKQILVLASLFGAGLFIMTGLALIAVFGTGIFIVTGIILIVLAVLGFFIGRGLWRGQRWARIVAIVLAVLDFMVAILLLTTADVRSFVNLVISGLINGLMGSYLLFSKSVKDAF